MLLQSHAAAASRPADAASRLRGLSQPAQELARLCL